MVNLEDLCLVFLVETSHRVFWYQSLFRMSKIWVAVSDLVETEIIILVVLSKTSCYWLTIPLFVFLWGQCCSFLHKWFVAASNENYRVWVNVLLEFRLEIYLFSLFSFFCIFWRIISLSLSLRFYWSFRCDEENISCSFVALRISIKDVTSILTIILAQSPSESTRQQLRWNLLFGWVFFLEFVNL